MRKLIYIGTCLAVLSFPVPVLCQPSSHEVKADDIVEARRILKDVIEGSGSPIAIILYSYSEELRPGPTKSPPKTWHPRQRNLELPGVSSILVVVPCLDRHDHCRGGLNKQPASRLPM